MNGLTRSQLSKRCGINPETLRYYEKIGIIPRPPRSASNYRLYPEQFVSRIRFIRRGQELGFTLREIRELFELRADDGARCTDVRRRAEDKLADVDEKIRSLRAIRRALAVLVTRCASDGPTEECPILEALDAE